MVTKNPPAVLKHVQQKLHGDGVIRSAQEERAEIEAAIANNVAPRQRPFCHSYKFAMDSLSIWSNHHETFCYLGKRRCSSGGQCHKFCHGNRQHALRRCRETEIEVSSLRQQIESYKRISDPELSQDLYGLLAELHLDDAKVLAFVDAAISANRPFTAFRAIKREAKGTVEQTIGAMRQLESL